MAVPTSRIIPACKWLITMVIVSPLSRVVGPLPNGHSWSINRGDPNHLSTPGNQHQVLMWQLVVLWPMSITSFVWRPSEWRIWGCGFQICSNRIHGTGISTYIWLMFVVNVGKYTIHGAYGVFGSTATIAQDFPIWFWAGKHHKVVSFSINEAP